MRRAAAIVAFALSGCGAAAVPPGGVPAGDRLPDAAEVVVFDPGGVSVPIGPADGRPGFPRDTPAWIWPEVEVGSDVFVLDDPGGLPGRPVKVRVISGRLESTVGCIARDKLKVRPAK